MRKRFRDLRNLDSQPVTEEAPVNATGASVSGTEGTVIVRKKPIIMRRKSLEKVETSE